MRYSRDCILQTIDLHYYLLYFSLPVDSPFSNRKYNEHCLEGFSHLLASFPNSQEPQSQRRSPRWMDGSQLLEPFAAASLPLRKAGIGCWILTWDADVPSDVVSAIPSACLYLPAPDLYPTKT